MHGNFGVRPLSLILTVPVVIWSDHIQELLGYSAPSSPGSEWIDPVLGTVVFLYGGMVFLKSAWGELNELAKLSPDEATRIVDGETENVSVDELSQGDLVLVRPGDRVPVNGVIREGRSNLYEAMITGESQPVTKK